MFLLLVLPVVSLSAGSRTSMSEGLSNNSVKAIYQDVYGYMWFGTKNGLNRYDGYEIKSYYYDDGTTQKNDIVSIFADSDGMMWLGTFNGVVLFDSYTNRFVDLDSRFSGEFPEGVVTGMFIRDTSDIWVATKKGLYRFRNGVCAPVTDFKGKHINAMGYGGDDYILMDVVSEGLYCMNTVNGEINEVEVKGSAHRSAANVIVFDGSAAAWLFATEGEIVRYDRIEGTARMLGNPLSASRDNEIHSAICSGGSTMLLAADSGVLCLDANTAELKDYFQNSSFKASRRIMSLFRDEDENLWMGSFEDGFRIYNRRMDGIRNIALPFADNDRVVSDMLEVAGKLVVGCHDKVILYDIRSKRTVVIPIEKFPGVMSRNTIYTMSRFSKDEVVVYVLNSGMFVLNVRSFSIRRLDVGLEPESQIRAVREDAEGNLWMAADELVRYRRRDNSLFHDFSTNQTGYTRYMLTQTIFMEKDGSMLVGTRNNGIWRYQYNKHGATRYSDAVRIGGQRLAGTNVVQIYVDTKERIWIGTFGSGLFVCDRNGAIIREISAAGSHKTICGIVEDGDGNIWVSTYDGLSKIDSDTFKLFNCDSRNGYPQMENSYGALVYGSDALIYVGGSNNVCVIEPTAMFDSGESHVAARYSSIECLRSREDALYQDFSSLEQMEDIVFGHKNTSLKIKFSSQKYLYQNACLYAYRLDDSSERWTIINDNEVVLSNLSYGKHILQVKCSDEYGVWGEEVNQLEFRIKPPFYLSEWSVALYVVLMLVLIVLFCRYMVQRKRTNYEKLVSQIEKENIEKTYNMRMELFTQFSHELRTPLTLIKDPVEEILADRSFPEKYRYTMMQIEKNAGKMLLLVNQLLDMRKIEHGDLKLNLSRLDCRSFLTEQAENFQSAAQRRSITLLHHCDCDPEDLWCDAGLMDRVMANLISNALKYTPAGGTIEMGITLHGKDKVRMLVKDTGIGIAKENIDKIFDPFYQISSVETKSFGSGIGLTLARYIVNLHKAKIWVESEPSKGSRFIVELQRGIEHFSGDEKVFSGHNFNIQMLPSVSAMDAQPFEADVDDDATEKPVVLVVEDDDELKRYIADRLKRHYNVIEAEDGEKGLELAVKTIPDLIISDIMMPNTDGLELCRKIKEGIATSHIPLILLTAKSLHENIEAGYSVLADDYVLKPFSMKVLIAKCRSLIANRNKLKQKFSEEISRTDISSEALQQDPFLAKVMELVTANIESADLNVKMLYTEMGMSRAQFFRKIKSISTLSPNKIVMNIRMNLASEMLRQGTMNVSEVAYRTGFSDPAYFSKVFKSVYDVSPINYQKKYAKNK